MVKKYWEADIKGHIIVAPTLKELAAKLKIKPSMIEGVYYRSRLQDKIKITKIVESMPRYNHSSQVNAEGLFVVSFE